MTTVLVLGGSAWLGSRIADRWIERGASVTCLARGTGPTPPGATFVATDRSVDGAYDAVRDVHWDEVVDVSRDPAHVAGAVAALARAAGHWTFVSSLSVYADVDEVGADESAALSIPAQPGDEYDYSRAKSACEASVREALPDRSAIVRPGLIVGPGDPTDRFGYWVGRFALAGAGPVLVPDTAGRTAQIIDVDDLARFVVDVCGRGWTGIANAISAPAPLGDVLALAREVAGHTGAAVEASDEALAAADVAHWSGPRSLPLWLPRDMPGFSTRSPAAYLRAGGRVRPWAQTMARALADERERGLERAREAGMTRADELAVLATLD